MHEKVIAPPPPKDLTKHDANIRPGWESEAGAGPKVRSRQRCTHLRLLQFPAMNNDDAATLREMNVIDRPRRESVCRAIDWSRRKVGGNYVGQTNNQIRLRPQHAREVHAERRRGLLSR